MVFVQNWPFFHLLSLGNISQENVFYDILQRKNAFLGYKNSMFKKWKKCDFCKGVNPWFLSKIGHFSMSSFQAIQARKMCFTIFQNEKTPLQAIKTRSSKSRKIEIFPAGVNPWFWSKISHFSIFFFLGIIGQENVFYDILEGKNAFLGYKNSKFKKWKNCNFCKGVNPWFWFKIGHFSIFFFRHYRAGKCVLRYSRTKKRLSRL